jgi:hypothetical protein
LLIARSGSTCNDPSAASASSSKKQRTWSPDSRNHSSLRRACAAVENTERGPAGACSSVIRTARSINAAHVPGDRKSGTTRKPSRT